MPMDAVLVVLVEGVHDHPRLHCQELERSGYSWPSTMTSP
jgi:hypothetical protein